jgi:glycosyltransferase involved in cell wall biosynthesis
MALGTPVVALAEMGTREVLRQDQGCLIARDDPSHFAEQCIRVLKDAALRAALAERARRYAQQWSAPVLADRMIAFYAGALRRAQAGSNRDVVGSGTPPSAPAPEAQQSGPP